MKRTLAWTLTALVLASAAALPGYGQSSQDVLNKMLNAMGGRKAIEAVKDSTTTGAIEITQYGMSGTITMYQKEPNKMRMDIEVMGMVITQAFDGQKGWYTNPQTGTTEEMTEQMSKDFARQAMGNDSLLNPQKYGITYAVKPKEKIENKDYIVLEQTLSDGHKNTFYLDPDNFLVYKTKTRAMNQAGVEVEAESFPTDYKKVGDLVVAHSIRQLQDGAEFMKMTITKISNNSGLEDSFFALSK